MKKILVLLFLAVSATHIAQESVVLRVNYEKGGKYITNITQSITSEAMMMGMNIDMATEVKDAKDAVYTTESKITKIAMDMMQGGMNMSYDSSKKDEELDEMGLMMKSQMSPILNVMIFSKTNNLGEVLEMKMEPSVPSAGQFQNLSSSVVYPEKAVKVGDTWSDEKENQGVKTTTEYKVTSITKTKVLLDCTGTLSGAGKGTLKGNLEIDRKSGLPIQSNIKIDMTASGQNMKISVNVAMKKA